jgi:peptidoglycan/LPS O-acetylase OafA/YrhL
VPAEHNFHKGILHQNVDVGHLPGWSLTVEETFYILAPLIFFFIRRKYFFPSNYFDHSLRCLLVLFFNAFPFQGFFSDFHFLLWEHSLGGASNFSWESCTAVALKNNQMMRSQKGSSYTF